MPNIRTSEVRSGKRPADQGNDSEQMVHQLAQMKRENKMLRSMTVSAILLGVASLVLSATLRHIPAVHAAQKDDGILRVRGLIVEDEHGVERVRLGAPLPDPMGTDGVRHHRQGVISGMLISDAKGTERGGYVTSDASDEAFLSLDSRKGQEVLFLANPGGGTNLDLFDKAGNEAELTVFPDGPKFVMKKEKKIILQLPQSSAPK